MRKLTITSCENGFILKDEYIDSKGDKDTCNSVIQANDEFVDDVDTLTKLLHAVNDVFGMSYDKFGKDNLKVSYDLKGHKLE